MSQAGAFHSPFRRSIRAIAIFRQLSTIVECSPTNGVGDQFWVRAIKLPWVVKATEWRPFPTSEKIRSERSMNKLVRQQLWQATFVTSTVASSLRSRCSVSDRRCSMIHNTAGSRCRGDSVGAEHTEGLFYRSCHAHLHLPRCPART